MRLILRENTEYSNKLNLEYKGYIQTVIVDEETNKLLFSYEGDGLLSDLVKRVNFDVDVKKLSERKMVLFLDVYQYNPDGEKIHFATVSPDNPLTQEFEKQEDSYPHSFKFADTFTVYLIEESVMKDAISGGWGSINLNIDEVASQIDELEGTIRISLQKISAIKSAAAETTLKSSDVRGAENKFVELVRNSGLIDIITSISDTYTKLSKYTKLSTSLSKKAQLSKTIYNYLVEYTNLVDPVDEITILVEKMFDTYESATDNGPALVNDGVPTVTYYIKEENFDEKGDIYTRVYVIAPSKPLYSQIWWWYVPSENQVWQINEEGFVLSRKDVK
jgi:hypothetical protein